METFQFESYEAMVDSSSPLVKQFPGMDIGSFRKLHYFELLTHVIGCVFYSFYLILFLVHGKTFFIAPHTFYAIFLIQIISFGASLAIQKFSFAVNNVEYATYSYIPYLPKFIASVCDRVVVSQMPLYWFVITAFLIIQIAQFSSQNPRSIRFAHIYLFPIGIVIFLIAITTPDHMKHFMIVVCFLIWWIYRKHMVAQLYSQEMSAKDILNMRRMNIWLSCQIFATLMFHLVELGVTLAIKSSVMDTNRQTYYGFYRNEVFRGIMCIATYINALLFVWATIDFVKTNPNKEITTLPVFVGGSLQMESFSRRPSAISAFSLNNVAPLTPRDANMLHI
ncbi:hypothetical protein GCK72_023782 [Caenorhabditis remanei]|uniref:Uncharacterized protein n=1 Tax=Caenorhabditis remanei TaxID=31234 RepID=A0A6A5FXD7_CAERE|nr:hypothetical protein GCK72_023782 [Caenorhabditis remanei]KAF1747320.1 hypothetical protein GCK72_023782 [Caenorhabditis remanei]